MTIIYGTPFLVVHTILIIYILMLYKYNRCKLAKFYVGIQILDKLNTVNITIPLIEPEMKDMITKM